MKKINIFLVQKGHSFGQNKYDRYVFRIQMLCYKVNKTLIKYAKHICIELYQITLAIHTQM